MNKKFFAPSRSKGKYNMIDAKSFIYFTGMDLCGHKPVSRANRLANEHPHLFTRWEATRRAREALGVYI